MSYLVLARKWRPRRFAELVGQEHVVRALGNALESGRVHHAYLFTGTRGVGKTTIARIFAKSLNCEKGVGADPCGECAVCTAVDAGRFVDLLEIDAASNTGVDDVREVIENAQYLPTRGRYKVYLIDEVHMLSRQAFNALLKTLEEPPEHVKFLLATTDPDKLPVTVLSRCLQFNLKRLSEEQISAQMRMILAAESIEADADAIDPLAHAADGSLRDGLSLLDQAIAYAAGRLDADAVRSMLGTVDRNQVAAILSRLAAVDGAGLLKTVEHLAGYAPDFDAVLDALAERLHQLQVAQLVPASARDDGLSEIERALPAETVALWYQMCVQGGRELPLAPSPRIGFEMCLLRMLAFHPDPANGEALDTPAVSAARKPSPPAPAASASAVREVEDSPVPAPASATVASPSNDVREPAAQTPNPEPAAIPQPTEMQVPEFDQAQAAQANRIAEPPSAPVVAIADNEQWLARLAGADLRGPARELAANAVFRSLIDDQLRLALPASHDHLRIDALVDQLADQLQPVLGIRPKLRIDTLNEVPSDATLSARERGEKEQRQRDAEDAFMNHPGVRGLIEEFGARAVPDSIRPND